jgi:hypothetical protein
MPLHPQKDLIKIMKIIEMNMKMNTMIKFKRRVMIKGEMRMMGIKKKVTQKLHHHIQGCATPLLAVIKYTYLLPTYPNFIQDIEDRCLLLTSSTSFVDLPFQEHQMMEKHHMDQNPFISSICPK